MADTARKRRFPWFLFGVLMYALLFLGAAAFGLTWFWNYIDAYEQSQPETAMNAYMEGVDADYLCAGGAAPVMADVDLRIQSEEACLSYIKSTLSDEIHYACKMNECTDDRMVYMVMCGERGVCKVTLAPQPADRYGFARWAVVSEEFDLSYIKSSTRSVTVPNYFSVSIGDARLDESYMTATATFPELADYYESDSPPYLVTYRSGAFLGDLSFDLINHLGEPVTMDENTDLSEFVNNCTPEQITLLDELTDSYVRRYVDFLSCTGNDLNGNYRKLMQYVVPDSELAQRFQAALSGMYWINDRRSSVTDLSIHRRVDLGNGRFLCTATYEVDTHLVSGLSHEITDVLLIITETDGGLKVERMTFR